jgi:hypothetical protein
VTDQCYDRHGKAEFIDFLKQLVGAIRTFINGWNDRCHPFTWTKTAGEILPHATRKRDSDALRYPLH